MITGASSGIGESACMALIQHGYEVIAGVRADQDSLRLAAAGNSKIHPLIMDVTDPAGMEKAKETALHIIGDGSLVAIFTSRYCGQRSCSLCKSEEWQKRLDVNLTGVIRTIIFFPLLAKPRNWDDHPRGSSK